MAKIQNTKRKKVCHQIFSTGTGFASSKRQVYSEVPNGGADRNKRTWLEKHATLLAHLLDEKGRNKTWTI